MSEDPHLAGRLFNGKVAALLWALQAQDDAPDLRSVALCGPRSSGHFELTWAREGRLVEATHFTVDHTRADVSKMAVSLAKRAARDDFFWRDLGSAPVREPLAQPDLRWQGQLLRAMWVAEGYGPGLEVRRAEISRGYRETALVVDWAEGGRLSRLVLDIPPGDGSQAAAESLADDVMLGLFEGPWNAVDVGPA